MAVRRRDRTDTFRRAAVQLNVEAGHKRHKSGAEDQTACVFCARQPSRLEATFCCTANRLVRIQDENGRSWVIIERRRAHRPLADSGRV